MPPNNLTVLWSTLKCLAFHSNYNKKHWSRPPPSARLYCGRPWNAFHLIYIKNRWCLGPSTILWLTLEHVVCHFIYNKSLVSPQPLDYPFPDPEMRQTFSSIAWQDLTIWFLLLHCFLYIFQLDFLLQMGPPMSIMSQWSARSLPAADQVVFCAVSSGCKWPQVSL